MSQIWRWGSLKKAVLLGILLCFLPWTSNASQQPESVNKRWPREIVRPGGKIVVYQPQLLSLKDVSLTARAPVAVTPKGLNQPIFGAIWVAGKITTDRQERLVHCEKFFITQVRFPGSTKEQRAALQAILKQETPPDGITFSLDELIAMLDMAEKTEQTSEELSIAPPNILAVTCPAILVALDGEPVLEPVPGKDLLRVVNTPYAMVQEPSTKAFYLRAGQRWWKAQGFRGPWEVTEDLPATVSSLLPSPPKPAISSPEEQQPLPKIVVATEPTELFEISGEGELEFVDDTKLFYVTNTNRDVLTEENQLYVLLSGRWFTASSKAGPWTYVPSTKLSDEFKKIPETFERSHVRMHIAGTREAQEARLDTFIPQTAVIKRSDKSLKVFYDGDPIWGQVDGTPMQYAMNTPYDVLEVGGHYHCCFEGVWYDSVSAQGPWAVSISVPPEVSGIPPQCPLYPVKFVRIYDHTDDVVFTGYTPGYLGSYVQDQAVVFGTGYHYPSWKGKKYFPRSETYGFSALYEPLSGSWMFHPPRLGKGTWAGSVLSVLEGGDKPWLGESGWWGIAGYRQFGAHLRPLLAAKNDLSAPTSELDNLYLHSKDRLAQATWGSKLQLPSGGDNQVWDNDKMPVKTEADSSEVPETPQEGDSTSESAESSDERWERLKNLSAAEQAQTDAQIAKKNEAAKSGDLYSDEEGNVYNRGDEGWENVGGSADNPPEDSTRESRRKERLDRESESRDRGVTRRRDLIHSTGRMSRTYGYGGDMAYESTEQFNEDMGFIQIPAFGG
jgi:hypothetical protein